MKFLAEFRVLSVAMKLMLCLALCELAPTATALWSRRSLPPAQSQIEQASSVMQLNSTEESVKEAQTKTGEVSNDDDEREASDADQDQNREQDQVRDQGQNQDQDQDQDEDSDQEAHEAKLDSTKHSTEQQEQVVEKLSAKQEKNVVEKRGTKHDDQDSGEHNTGDEAEDDDDDNEEQDDASDDKLKSSSKVAKLQDQLNQNLQRQASIKAKIALIDNPEASQLEIRNDIAEVANQTDAPALARVLGKMWSEMREVSGPSYRKNLVAQLSGLNRDEADLRNQIEQEKTKLHSLGTELLEKNQTGEKKLPAGTKRGEPKKSSKGGSKEPIFTKDTMPAVSPTVQCLICLLLQYFLLYSVLAIVRIVNQTAQRRFDFQQKAVEGTAASVTYAPILSVLFIATRMRAIALTKGETEKYGLPTQWTQIMMYVCTVAMFMQAVIFFTIRIAVPPKTGKTSNAATGLQESPNMKNTLAVSLFIAMVCMYGGFVFVCTAAVTMRVPEEVWGGAPPETPAALQATLLMTSSFFLIYIGHAICWTLNRLPSTQGFTSGKMEQLFNTGKTDVNLAPMLCTLFMACRLHAEQVNRETGTPQPWAQNCFFIASYAMIVQVLCTIFMPSLDSDVRAKEDAAGEVKFEFRTMSIKIAGAILKYGALLCVYGASFAVIVSMFSVGPPGTKVPPSVLCIIIMSAVYLIAYTILLVVGTVQDMQNQRKSKIYTICQSGCEAVMFAPMLGILFLGTRMRALQLTRYQNGQMPLAAGPQAWVQEAMFLATAGFLMQLLITYVTTTHQSASRGMRESDRSVDSIRVIGYMAKLTCLVVMYCGTFLVISGIFLMTPETLPPYAPYTGFIPGVNIVDVPTM